MMKWEKFAAQSVVFCFVLTMVAASIATDLRAKPLNLEGSKVSNIWNKTALKAQSSKQGFSVKMRKPGRFDDASLWAIHLNKPVAVKQSKLLSFTIKSDTAHKSIWGPLLFSMQVNGKPLRSTTQTQLLKTNNGQHYIAHNPQSQNIVLRLPNGIKTIRDLSITTAGADNLGFRLTNLSLVKESNASQTVANAKIPRLQTLATQAWSAFGRFSARRNHPYSMPRDPSRSARIFRGRSPRLDVSGGWFDAGDYGKYVVNTGHTTTLIALTGLLYPQAMPRKIRSLNAIDTRAEDWKDIVQQGLDWMLKMQRNDGGVYHKVASASFPSMRTSPAADKAARFVMPVSSTATAQFATALSLGSLVFKGDIKGEIYALAAQKAFQWLDRNPRLAMVRAKYGKHSYGGHYGDNHDTDERFMAAAARFLAFSKGEPSNRLIQQRIIYLAAKKGAAGWRDNDLIGFWILHATGKKLSPKNRQQTQGVLKAYAKKWQAAQARSPFAITYSKDEPVIWGFNGILALRGWHLALAGKTFNRPDWALAARKQLGWFFGANPNAQIMVSGKHGIRNPHFRPYTSGTTQRPTGLLVGGPNGERKTGDKVLDQLAHKPPLARHADNAKSYASNEVAINWQAAWATSLSLIQHATNSAGRQATAVPLP